MALLKWNSPLPVVEEGYAWRAAVVASMNKPLYLPDFKDIRFQAIGLTLCLQGNFPGVN
jgi:hypothetical protein